MTATLWSTGYLTGFQIWLVPSWTEMVAAIIDRYSMGQIDAAEAPSQARLALAIAVAIELQEDRPGCEIAVRPMDDPVWERPAGALVLDPRTDLGLISSLVGAGFLTAGRL